ncbi:diguanylate cyclase [Pseudodesulfovibrio sp.]|nr:diguanylate cyclase [Pseudodesulfovibrio sp.]
MVDNALCPEPDGTSRIIVLEPDSLFAKVLAMAIWSQSGMKPCIASTVSEAATLMHDHPEMVFSAVVSLEAPGVEAMLDKLTQLSVPSIVYGTEFDEDTRKHLSTLSIADLVLGSRDNLPVSVGKALGRMARNRDVAILVADDSRSMRMALIRFLRTRRYTIIEATDGVEALEQLAKHPEIKLVITDNEMPNMDGFTLVKEIRKSHSMDDLAVIGISAKTNSQLSVKFINNGANDFLQKPFLKEELFCRVNHNVEMLDRIEIIRDLSNKDPLTKLYNRRYFFDHCEEFVIDAENAGKSVVVSMLDIDHFKRFNDTYGHDVGDDVIITVSRTIQDAFPDDAIVCRFGGEEFCVLAAHEAGEDIFARYDMLRRAIDGSPVAVDGESVVVTVSVGVCTEKDSVGAMIKVADTQLYAAKESGRNKVVIT